MDSGHKTLNDAVLVVDDFGKRGKAVGRARGVREDVDVLSVLVLIDAHDEHRSIGRGRRDDDLLRATLQVCLGLV